MKRKALIPVLVCLLLAAGCSSVHLTWGDVEYTAYGDTSLRDVEVTRECDGCRVSVSAKRSETSSAEMMQGLADTLSKALDRIPAQ